MKVFGQPCLPHAEPGGSTRAAAGKGWHADRELSVMSLILGLKEHLASLYLGYEDIYQQVPFRKINEEEAGMNLNGLVLNLSLSGLCVHSVVELQPAAERKPHRKLPPHQSSQEKSLRVQKNPKKTDLPPQKTNNKKISLNTCREIIA